jgi:hypothetical protein
VSSSTSLAVFRHISFGVSIESGESIVSANKSADMPRTYWLASPSPSILGTYGAGISRRYSFSQSTSLNQGCKKISAAPLRRFPNRLLKSPTSRFLSSSLAVASK